MARAKKKIIRENPEKVKEKQDMQLKWVIIIATLVILSFICTYAYVQSLDKFSFLKVNWQKMKSGEITLYYSKFKFANETPVYNLYLRYDPRKNNIPINGALAFRNEVAIISFDPNVEVCAGANTMLKLKMDDFFKAINYKEIRGAISNESIARQMNTSYVDCSNVVGKTVIIVNKSDKPSIEQIKTDCYIMNVGNCENIKVSERLILGMLEKLSGERIK